MSVSSVLRGLKREDIYSEDEFVETLKLRNKDKAKITKIHNYLLNNPYHKCKKKYGSKKWFEAWTKLMYGEKIVVWLRNSVRYKHLQKVAPFIRIEKVRDVFENMLNGHSFNKVITNNNTANPTDMGFIFEAVVILCLIIVKPFNYKGITIDNFNNFPNFEQCSSIKNYLEKSIHNNDGPSDITFIDENRNYIPFSIKYRDNISPKDVELNQLVTILKTKNEDYKIGAIVKDKRKLIDHVFQNRNNIHKKAFDKTCEDGLLFDEGDVKGWYKIFQSKFSGLSYNDAIEKIDQDYFNTSRKSLKLRLHQKLFELAFFRNFDKNKLKHLLFHKMRSGKSISLLNVCNLLLNRGMKRILIMTSAPKTIDSFKKPLGDFIEFKHIKSKEQKDLFSLDDSFNGIVFSSVQYFKNGKQNNKKTKKKKKLKDLNFDCMIFDESHNGESNTRTCNIFGLEENKLVIFASGTAHKTKTYYNIPHNCVYEWGSIDEGCMKNIQKNKDTDVIKCMTARHGSDFAELLNDVTLDKDYSKYPIQVLIRPTIVNSMIEKIKLYNSKHGTSYGFDFSSIFALEEKESKKKKKEYKNKFNICKIQHGRQMLKHILERIISSDPMDKTIMNEIEETQSNNESKHSTKNDPGMFLVYLPTHNRYGNISQLQKTLVQFLKDENIWTDYHIEYTNSMSSSQDNQSKFDSFISNCMKDTKKNEKKGCILLLGEQGTLGINYPDCHVTISLDNGHNLDNQKQKWARAGMDATGKNVYINVDMNIQRVYLELAYKIREYIKSHQNTTKSYDEILKWYCEQNIFMFNPSQINFGKMASDEINNYYKTIGDDIRDKICVSDLLEQIECEDVLRPLLRDNGPESTFRQDNKVYEGLQQNCPVSTTTKTKGDPITNKPCNPNEQNENHIDEPEEYDYNPNLTKNVLSRCIKTISLVHRLTKGKIQNLGDVLSCEWSSLIYSVIEHNLKISYDINKETINKIIDILKNIMNAQDDSILNQIKEKYLNAHPDKFRKLVEEDFQPSKEERNGQAEVSTFVCLVDDMLNKMPISTWTAIHKIFEPCCGKGNFVLGIFDKYYHGLVHITDKAERCKIIIERCLYFGDISALNVTITKALLITQAEKYCGVIQEYNMNTFVDDTLELDIQTKWNIDEFYAVIGNPPYSTNPSKPNSKPLYNLFTEKFIDKCKYMLYVVPSRWFVGGKGLNKFRSFMMKRKDIKLIHHEDNAKKWFGKNVDIEGGTNYFLKDSSYNGLCIFNDGPYDLSKYDRIIKPKYHKNIDRVNNIKSVDSLYMGRCFGIETNDKCLKDNGKIKCYVSSFKSKNRYTHIDSYNFNETNTFWKVITARANGKRPNFGVKFIAKPNEVHTGSYISFKVNNEEEAKSLLSYLETKFANYMLSIRKISQDISKNTCKWIPLVPLTKIWSDKDVYDYFKLTEEDITSIEKSI
jgi:hypothetical protein